MFVRLVLRHARAGAGGAPPSEEDARAAFAEVTSSEEAVTAETVSRVLQALLVMSAFRTGGGSALRGAAATPAPETEAATPAQETEAATPAQEPEDDSPRAAD